MIRDLELVTTGAELLNGGVVNRHAHWLGARLEEIGWRLTRDTTVPDDLDVIRDVLAAAFTRTETVIVSGGLGPTTDDVTRDAAATLAKRKIVMHEPTRKMVVDAWKKRGRVLNDLVERHALVVEGAEVLENRQGFAPGEHLEINGCHLFLLPGPTREFRGVITDSVLPWLGKRAGGAPPRLWKFQSAGLGESTVAARLREAGLENLRVEVAYCARPSMVTLRIREVNGHADDFEQAGALARQVLGPALFSDTGESIEEAVVRMLGEAGVTLATAESCTGGLVGQKITSIPGSSVVYRGGVVAYDNEVKSGLLGIDPKVIADAGAVSEEVARAMASGVRKVCSADIGLGITGIAGPSGGTPDKPVGLVYIALADAKDAVGRKLQLGGDRETVREAAATLALDLVRQRLQKRAEA